MPGGSQKKGQPFPAINLHAYRNAVLGTFLPAPINMSVNVTSSFLLPTVLYYLANYASDGQSSRAR
jgi:hypothetical protein